MLLQNLPNAPEWLRTARTADAEVDIVDGVVVWHSGTWHSGLWLGGTWLDGLWLGGLWLGGTWLGGTWHSGTWLGGTWRDGLWLGGLWLGGTWLGGTWLGGTWHSGTWHSGTWRDGLWHSGTWRDGTWHGGTWRDGTWLGGTWLGGENRLYFHASLIGIVFDADDCAIAYRTTHANGHGRYESGFVQTEGVYVESDLPPAGSGTCVKGIHVTTAATAWTYFGIDPTCQFWRVKFTRTQLLDCDGQKARISGGVFTKIDRPF